MQPLRILLAGLLALTLSCQTKPKQEAKTDAATATPDSAAALATRPAAGAPRSAADRLVRALYFEHRKEENPFKETKDRSLVDQFFARPVADQIWASREAAKANLLFNAPDAAVKKAWVEPAAIGGSKAVVYVTFENNTKPEEIRVNLQQTTGRWRITNMLYPNGKQLTDMLQ